MNVFEIIDQLKKGELSCEECPLYDENENKCGVLISTDPLLKMVAKTGEIKCWQKFEKQDTEIRDFPLLVKNILKALDSDIAHKTVIMMYNKGEEGMMFYDLCNFINGNMGKTIHIQSFLAHLMRYGLLYQQYMENSFDNRYLKYTISTLGKITVEKLMTLFE